jgi:phosphate transport system substrate-binding protein
VELIYAEKNQISSGTVRNASGNWVRASVESVTEAADGIRQLPADYRISITDPPGRNAYPISSFTWLLVPLRSMDATRGKALKGLLDWIETEGQGEAAALAYAPLPRAVAERVLQTISTLH